MKAVFLLLLLYYCNKTGGLMGLPPPASRAEGALLSHWAAGSASAGSEANRRARRVLGVRVALGPSAAVRSRGKYLFRSMGVITHKASNFYLLVQESSAVSRNRWWSHSRLARPPDPLCSWASFFACYAPLILSNSSSAGPPFMVVCRRCIFLPRVRGRWIPSTTRA